MSRFDRMIETVDTYQKLAGENYVRVRKLAEDIRQGFCDFLDAKDGICVHLVPPMGAFEPKPYGDQAFTVPPRGFRPLGPIAFGLAVRVTRGTNWIRLALSCHKVGDDFTVAVQGGPSYKFTLPVADHDPSSFYELVFDHIHDQFLDAIERYKEGEYSSRTIGFDFSDDEADTGTV